MPSMLSIPFKRAPRVSARHPRKDHCAMKANLNSLNQSLRAFLICSVTLLGSAAYAGSIQHAQYSAKKDQISAEASSEVSPSGM